MEDLAGVGPNWLAEVGIGPAYKTRAHYERRPPNSKNSKLGKRIVGHSRASPRKRACVEEVELSLEVENQAAGIDNLFDSFLSLAAPSERDPLHCKVGNLSPL